VAPRRTRPTSPRKNTRPAKSAPKRSSTARTGFTHQARVGATDEWYTPPSIFKALGLQFDLDAASPGKHVVPWVPATRCYTLADDGLTRPWGGRVYLNAPYSSLAPWMRRMSAHGHGIALTFARTDTRWWHETTATAQAICLVKGRIRFVQPNGVQAKGAPGAPSVLIAWGADCVAALERSGLGQVWHLRNSVVDAGGSNHHNGQSVEHVFDVAGAR